VVVASRDLAPGTVVQLSDLGSVRVAGDSSSLIHLIDAANARQLVGMVTTGDLRRGDFVQAGALTDAGTEDRRPEVTVTVDADRVPAVGYRVGETVAVLATYDGCTTLVAPDARVAVAGDGKGGGISLDVASADDAAAVVNAAVAGKVTLLRPGNPAPLGTSTACAPSPVTVPADQSTSAQAGGT
jgi:hypothetical protein